MSKLPDCPKCGGTYAYEDGNLIICPECAHEWSNTGEKAVDSKEQVLDAHGVVLEDGDSIFIIKDLKVKGSSTPLKQGTRVKNIQLVPGADHNISCKIDGFGAMDLKSEFVKKS